MRQIITGGTCHLDAKMIGKHLDGWELANLDLLIIENVGNLVCPSSYDLGEDCKIVLLSTTEGEDKPMPRFAKPLALASIATWIALILAGRFLAYTHRWEMLGVPAIL